MTPDFILEVIKSVILAIVIGLLVMMWPILTKGEDFPSPHRSFSLKRLSAVRTATIPVPNLTYLAPNRNLDRSELGYRTIRKHYLLILDNGLKKIGAAGHACCSLGYAP